MTQRSRTLLNLLLIPGVFILFFAGARLFIDPAELPRSNQGSMIVPHVQLSELSLHGPDGQPWTKEHSRGKWNLVYVADGSCELACKNALWYQMRQQQRALDRDAPRVRRIIVHTAEPDEQLRGFLDNEAAGTLELQARPQTLKAAMQDKEDAPPQASGNLFIMSPDGMLILWYPTHPERDATLEEAQRIHDDLTHLLKGSLTG